MSRKTIEVFYISFTLLASIVELTYFNNNIGAFSFILAFMVHAYIEITKGDRH